MDPLDAKGLTLTPPGAAAERHRLLREWNDTAASFDRDACIHDFFAGWVQRRPEEAAVLFGQRRITYRELDEQANRLAHHLRGLGVGPEVRVGLCLERSPEMVAGILGILKAGGAYVPLDPAYPRERLELMADDAGMPVLVTQEKLLGLVPAAGRYIVRLDADRDVLERCPATVPASGVSAAHLAYVIYTSGSTGRPKGVLVEHRAASNLAADGQIEAFQLGPGCRVLQFASLSFDSSVADLLMAFRAGATLCLAPQEALMPGEPLLATLREQGITNVTLAPSVLAALPGSDLPALRTIIAGGEACPEALVDRWAPGRRFYNTYGPSEATVCSTFTLCTRGEGTPSLGRPITNTAVYLLDESLEPVAAGEAGELYLGGAGLARGYLGRPDLTAERFVPDPFGEEPGGRLYRTGDLGRHRSDGQLDFLGRADLQVKVRGFRIELEEVERALAGLPEVAQAAAVVQEGPGGDRRLVACVVLRPEAREAEAMDLRSRLAASLPSYMIPSAWAVLDALPLSPNGKLDRKKLELLAAEQVRSGTGDGLAPRTPIEEGLAAIWTEVLGLDSVGVEDDFFGLGGHSLLATQVLSRVRTAFGVDLPPRRLFEAPTIAGLAEAVEVARLAGPAAPLPPIEPLPPEARNGDLPLSFAQERLWFLDRLEPGSPLYVIPAAVRLRGLLDIAALAASLAQIVERHGVLRMAFGSAAGRPVQRLKAGLSLEVPEVDLAALPETERETEARQLAVAESRRPFDLSRPPLARAVLVRMDEGDHLLLFAMHHIASDGWSVGVLLRELNVLYGALAARSYEGGGALPRFAGEGAPALPIQYSDFAVWQRGWLQGETLDRLTGFWRERLAGIPPVLELPVDRPRPAFQTYRGARWPVAVSPGLNASLWTLGRRCGATPFMVLLAAFQTLLHRHNGQERIAVGSPVAGRNQEEIEGLIGFFVNTLVLTADLSGNPPFEELLGRARESALAAYAHQELPFEKLVAMLRPERSLGHTPLVQAMFVLQNVPPVPVELAGLVAEVIAVDTGTSAFDLTLELRAEDGGGLGGFFEYAADLFDEATAARLSERWSALLGGIAANAAARISELPVLPEHERHQALFEWNGGSAAEAVPVHERFGEWARSAPEAVAVVANGEAMSYGDLDRQAEALAEKLRAMGAGSETVVGIAMERSLDLAVALLGVLKAGAAYLPLDLGLPAGRLEWMLGDAGVRLVLAQAGTAERVPRMGVQVLRLPPGDQSPGYRVGRPINGAFKPDSSGVSPGSPGIDARAAAYVIYTSGSTGRPKGVVVPHGAMAGHSSAAAARFGIGPGDRVLQIASLAFDISVEEIFPTWTAGATLVFAPEGLLSTAGLRKLIEEEGLTVLNLPTAYWHEWTHELERTGGAVPEPVRLVIVGGERVSAERLAGWPEREGLSWINSYGPTETTVTATLWELPAERRKGGEIPIGRPLGGARVYVADRDLQLLPPGAPGEMVIGGPGVARGYLGRPDLTAAAFVPDPFAEENGERLYRTGDLVRHRPDGNLEFLGRRDGQVKVRGFRVEPGEAEAALRRLPEIRDAVVLARPGEAGELRLIAWVVPADPAEALDASMLQAALRESLPAYLVPSAFAQLAALPLSPTGKVDRRALPDPEVRQGGGSAAPADEMERALAGLWREVLGLDEVGVEDSFFDLGGHSLLLVRMHGRLAELIEGEAPPLVDLFRHPTVRSLARHLGSVPEAPAAADRGERLRQGRDRLGERRLARGARERGGAETGR